MSTPDTAPSWPEDLNSAKAQQLELRDQLILVDQLGRINTVCGVDVGFEDQNTVTRAAAVVLDFPSLALIDYAIARCPTNMPYIPGYLSFRECPAILQALDQLNAEPDLILCDGQGYAHPRRFGVACHLGILTGKPTIGVAKSRLIGTHQAIPEDKGCWVPLMDDEETIGAVLRTREKVKPLFISAGHKITLETAIDIVMACTTKYRLPETTRWADGIASRKGSFLKRLDVRR